MSGWPNEPFQDCVVAGALLCARAAVRLPEQDPPDLLASAQAVAQQDWLRAGPVCALAAEVPVGAVHRQVWTKLVARPPQGVDCAHAVLPGSCLSVGQRYFTHGLAGAAAELRLRHEPADRCGLPLHSAMLCHRLTVIVLPATMDIATDGLALDILQEQELGAGNIAQTVGFKVGMLFGGGFLMVIVDYLGMESSSSFAIMAGCVLVSLLNTLAFDEHAETARAADEHAPEVQEAQIKEVGIM